MQLDRTKKNEIVVYDSVENRIRHGLWFVIAMCLLTIVVMCSRGGHKSEPMATTKQVEFLKAERKHIKDPLQRAYVERFCKTAQEEQARYGIPASIILAQGLLESRAGKSKLCARTKNHFGIKCFSKKCRKNHCVNFTDDSHKDFFKKYDTDWASYREHSKLLSNARYKVLSGKRYQDWADGLQRLGYATSDTYAADLKRIIQECGLYFFD